MQELEHPMKIWNIDGMTNKAGKLTHFMDLIQTKKHKEKIQGYLWLSTFKPQFSWKDAAVDTNILPIIIHSPDWYTLILRPSIQQA